MEQTTQENQPVTTNNQQLPLIDNGHNRGAMLDADAIGTVGSENCGDMLRLWIKFKEEQDGRRIIDKASFQSFGCQTAIAVASLATEMIRGKTVSEALSLSSKELSAPLGALPPMKIHCAQLVEEALQAALAPKKSSQPCTTSHLLASTLLNQIQPPQGEGKLKIRFTSNAPTERVEIKDK